MDEQWKAMLAHEAFMTWLREYLPTWEVEHSGHVLALHDAWIAALAHAQEG